MSLFEVDGWNLKGNKIAFDSNEKSKPAKKKRKPRPKRKMAEENTVIEQSPEEETEVKEAGIERNKEKPTEKQPPSEKQMAVESQSKLTPLQRKMMEKLSGSRFRWINEKLYTMSSEDALKLFEDQPSLFEDYHTGFRSQVQGWPENPVDVLVGQIKSRSERPVNAPGGLPGLQTKQVVIADMGCGEAQLASDVEKFLSARNSTKRQKKSKRNNGGHKLDIKVHSFDLQKANDNVTVADVRNVPLEDESCSVVIFCLALMGTNFLDFINEAYRLLSPRGELWIAEIKSRLNENEGTEFVKVLKLCGFLYKSTDSSNKMFTRFEFQKPSQDIIKERNARFERRNKTEEIEKEKEELEMKRNQIAEGKWLLKPCIYKRR